MSFTAEQVAALRVAIATGALEVQNGAERVKYQSLSDMRRLLAQMEASLSASPVQRPTHFHPTFDRGA